MSESLGGKAIVVTGASSGIGRAIAEELGRAGAELWLVGRSQTELDATAAVIAADGGVSAHTAAIDIAKPGALAALIDGIAHDHLFALINNAGVMYPEPIIGADPGRWREMFDINLLAPLEACEAAVRRMRAHGRTGHLINIGSLAGRFDAGGVYGATKIGLEMITRTLRKELENDDIRVASIVPGGFRTNLARGLQPETLQMLGEKMAALGSDPDRMFGDPADIARLARYVLEQPIGFNISEMVVRPPASLEL